MTLFYYDKFSIVIVEDLVTSKSSYTVCLLKARNPSDLTTYFASVVRRPKSQYFTQVNFVCPFPNLKISAVVINIICSTTRLKLTLYNLSSSNGSSTNLFQMTLMVISLF